uniref:Uncharacterized protein n=1 Tax=Triticum urartu TaxID=4572 RepID=A0A8R7NXY9_TRIUA
VPSRRCPSASSPLVAAPLPPPLPSHDLAARKTTHGEPPPIHPREAPSIIPRTRCCAQTRPRLPGSCAVTPTTSGPDLGFGGRALESRPHADPR